MAAAGGYGTSLSDIAAILKEFYLPPVTEQLNNEVLLISRLESRDEELFGNQAVVPLHTGRSDGVGARGEGVLLPTADKQRFAKALYDLKYLYGRVRVTGPSMAKTASDRGSFLEILRAELDGIRNDLTKDLARQTYSAGTSQIVQCGTTTASTTVVLATTGDFEGAEAIEKGWVYPGMRIDIGTAADGDAIASNRTVVSVDATGPSLVISGAAVTTSSTHFISRTGSYVTGLSVGDSYEISGLKQVVSKTANTFGGIDSSAAGNEYWQNLEFGNGGTPRTISQDLLMQTWNSVRRAGGETSVIITTLGIQREYFKLLQSQVQFVEPMKLEGGWSSLNFMNKPLVADIDAPYGALYFLDEKYLKVFSNMDWHFLEEDGDVLKWVVDYDAWEAVLARYLNVGATRRNTQAVLYDITDAGV